MINLLRRFFVLWDIDFIILSFWPFLLGSKTSLTLMAPIVIGYVGLLPLDPTGESLET